MGTGETIAAVIAIIVALVVGWVKSISGKIGNLASDYVPRPQIDERFRSLEERLENELAAQERRSDKRFDSIDGTLANFDGKLDKILDRLNTKADKE